jgi:uncharacterized protein (DUF58 family)
VSVAELGAKAAEPIVLRPGIKPKARTLRREKPWRRHLRTTREGKAFIMVTIGVGVAAFNTGNNLLFLVLGFMLSLIVLSGVMSETVIQGLTVSRRLPLRAFAGKVCLIELVLRNNKPRSPSYSLEIEDLAEDAPTERRCYFLKVGPSAEQAAAYRRTLQQRGFLRFSGFRVATRYPFGIFEKWRVLEGQSDLLVYPALLRDDEISDEAKSMGLDAPTPRIGVGTEIGGLRSYEMHDDARSIHWKRSASLGRLLVMERHSDASSQLCILLDNARPANADAAWDEGFERAISKAATLAVQSTARGLSVEVVVRGDRSPVVMPFAAADPILRYLALLASMPANLAPAFSGHSRSARVIVLEVRPKGAAA